MSLTAQQAQDFEQSVSCLVTIAEKLEAHLSPGLAEDEVNLRLTKIECAMLMALIRDAFR